MSSQVFAPHGVFSVRIDGRILHIHTRGPWNKELIEYFGKTMGAALASLAGSPWGILATVADEGMHTPDSYAAMVEGIRLQRKTGRCATAVVFDHVFGETLVRSVLERMYHDAGETAAFFDDEASAQEWLLARIGEAG